MGRTFLDLVAGPADLKHPAFSASIYSFLSTSTVPATASDLGPLVSQDFGDDFSGPVFEKSRFDRLNLKGRKHYEDDWMGQHRISVTPSGRFHSSRGARQAGRG